MRASPVETQALAHVRASLVALASMSRGGVPGVLVGNTAERLLRKLTVSVLAVKPADFVCPATR